MLDISPSYLNQIEHDVRPLTVAVLLRITEVFGVDATFFASHDDTRLVAEAGFEPALQGLWGPAGTSSSPLRSDPRRFRPVFLALKGPDLSH